MELTGYVECKDGTLHGVYADAEGRKFVWMKSNLIKGAEYLVPLSWERA